MTMRYFGVRGKGRNSSIHFHGRTYMYYRYSKRYSNFYKLMNRIFIMFLFFFFLHFRQRGCLQVQQRGRTRRTLQMSYCSAALLAINRAATALADRHNVSCSLQMTAEGSAQPQDLCKHEPASSGQNSSSQAKTG